MKRARTLFWLFALPLAVVLAIALDQWYVALTVRTAKAAWEQK